MYQLTYISTARVGMTEADVATILQASRANNRRDGITGLLISDGTRFLQALEGDKAAVESAYSRIKKDPRHRAAVILSSKDVRERQFGAWEMAFEGFGRRSDDGVLGTIVDKLVREVSDPNTRAMFSSFARLTRSQAA
jgi:hypothetical protein